MLYTSTHYWRIFGVMTLYSLLLLLHSNLAQQEEDAGISYITCDFDLENVEAIVPYLPEPCQQLYANRTEQLAIYQQYVLEALAFDRFIRKLKASEWPAGSERPTFNAELRATIYNDVNLRDCGGMNETSTTEEFLECQQERYAQLANAVPAAIVK